MEIIPIDENKQIYISPDIDDWSILETHNINSVIDVDGTVDIGIPTIADRILYVYFPFKDDDLPDIGNLKAVAAMGARLYQAGKKILVHCAMGYNRSALVIAMILVELGYSGKDAMELIRLKRKGALYNPKFSQYLEDLK